MARSLGWDRRKSTFVLFSSLFEKLDRENHGMYQATFQLYFGDVQLRRCEGLAVDASRHWIETLIGAAPALLYLSRAVPGITAPQ